MAYHIDEVNSDVLFEVNGDKVAIKVIRTSGPGGSGNDDIYLIKVGDETIPTDKNTLSALRIISEIAKLDDKFLSSKDNDTAEGLITFLEGLTSEELATLKKGLKVTGTTETDILKVLTSATIEGKIISVEGHTHTFASLTAKPSTLAGYGITDAYTETQVDTYLGLKLDKSVWDRVFYFDADNNLRVKLNLIGEKEVSVFGAGSSGDGGLITIVDNLTSTSKDAALSANQGRVLKSLIDGKISSVNWSDVTGKPTAFTPSAHTHGNSDLIGISAWAKQTTKPSYTYNEITGKPTNLADIDYVDWKVASLVDNAPEALDTLLELSAALGNDPNFATTVAHQIGAKLDKDDTRITGWEDANAKKHTHSNKTVLDGISNDNVLNWNDANTKKHTHANKSVIDGITSTLISNWNTAYTNNHTHANKSVIDGITSTKVSAWDGVVANWNKAFYFDADNNLRVKLNLVGEKEVSVFGAGSSGDGGLITIVDNLTSTSKDAALSANMGRELKSLIDGKVSSVSWLDITDKPSTFNPSAHTHTIANVTNLQTSLDAKVDKITGKSLSTNDFTTAYKTKLDGIATGANNYSLPTSSSTVLGGVKIGTGIANSGGVVSVAYGSAVNTACQGNDSRLSDSRNAKDVYSWAKAATKPSYTYSEIGGTAPTWNQNTTGNAATATKLNSRGKITAVSGTTKPEAGLSMYEVYNNGYPTLYGNLLRARGTSSSGGGELIMGWAGSDANGGIYYRSIRDNGNEWSAWKQVAFTDSNITGNAATATNVAWSGITSKPTTLAGFGITDAVTTSTFNSHTGNTTVHITSAERTSWNNKLDKSVWDSAFEIKNGAIRAKLNLVSEKEICAFGGGSITDGGLITIVDNLTSTSIDAALSANQGRVLKSLIDGKISSVNWSDVTGKPTTFTPSTHNHTSLNVTTNYGTGYFGGGNGDAASSASANVRLGTWYGFGIYPTVSGQAVTQNTHAFWVNARTGNTYTAGDFYAKGNTKVSLEGHTHNYLPLSGGAMTGNVVWVNKTGTATTLPSHIYRNIHDDSGNIYDHYGLSNSNINTFAHLRVFKNGGGVRTFRIGGDDTLTWEGRTIYHSGNIPTWNQNTTGNAATSDKVNNSYLSNLNSPDWTDNKVTFQYYDNNATNKPFAGNNANGVMNFSFGRHGTSGHYGYQLAHGNGSNNLYFRQWSGGSTNAWRTIAFIDSDITGNAATATKLQTINTTFTGVYPLTVNVNGNIYSHEGMKFDGAQNTLTVSKFKGTLEGNAATATNSTQLGGKTPDKFATSETFMGDLNSITSTGFHRLSGTCTNGAMTSNNGNQLVHMNWDTNAANQLYLSYGANNFYFRRKSSNKWDSWKQVAFTDSDITGNAATATNAAQLGGIVAANYWHKGNSNRFDVDWLCKGLDVRGYAQFDGQVYGFNDWYTEGSIGCDGNVNCFNLIATGEITAYSDRRLKSDIKPLENRGYIKPVTYKKDGKESIGFIAQDVKEKYPELVQGNGDKEMLSVNYQQYVAVLQAQIIELNERIEMLERRIK